MTKPRIGWPTTIVLVVVALFVIWTMIVIGTAFWNLTVVSGVGRQMADSLHERYPKLKFSGGARYEGVLHIKVKGETDEKMQREIMQLLVEQKAQRQLTNTLGCDFEHDGRSQFYWHDRGTKSGWRKVTMD